MEWIEVNSFSDIPLDGQRKIVKLFILGAFVIFIGIVFAVLSGRISSVFIYAATGLLVCLYGYYRIYKVKRNGLIRADFTIEKKSGYFNKSFTRLHLFEISVGNPQLLLLKEVEIDNVKSRVRVKMNIPPIYWQKFDENDKILVTYIADEMKLIKEDEYILSDYYGIKLY